MNRFLAEFISPTVCKLRLQDRSINSLCLKKLLVKFNSNIIDTFILISIGETVELDENAINDLRYLSIYLGNSEMFNKLNEMHPFELSIENVDYLIASLEPSNDLNYPFSGIYNNDIISFLSSNFYQIDSKKLLKISPSTVFLIINNENLKLTNEDSLLFFIEEYIKYNEALITSEEKQFLYESIEISCLSNLQMKKFIELIDHNEINRILWEKLKKCFCYYIKNDSDINSNRYLCHKKQVNVDFNGNNFDGIIRQLGHGNLKIVISENIVAITSSSIHDNSDDYMPKNIVDFDETKNQFYSDHLLDSWIMINFKNRKVKPSSYSIRSHQWGDANHFRMKNWVIEGLNDNVNWKILDTRNDENSINGNLAANNFKIQNLTGEDYFRYLKLRQLGLNTSNNGALIISALEFFGSYIEE